MSNRAVLTLGTALKNLRTDRGWTLSEVSERTEIPVSTLSKVENGKTDLTMDRLLNLTAALDVNIADLFSTLPPDSAQRDSGRRSITRISDQKAVPSDYGNFTYHAKDLLEKKISPIIAEIKSYSLEEFGHFHRHDGEEFVLVLDGELILHTNIYSPCHLKKDESIYFDSGMAHAYVAANHEPCRILIICSPLGNGIIRNIEADAPEANSPVVDFVRKAR